MHAHTQTNIYILGRFHCRILALYCNMSIHYFVHEASYLLQNFISPSISSSLHLHYRTPSFNLLLLSQSLSLLLSSKFCFCSCNISFYACPKQCTFTHKGGTRDQVLYLKYDLHESETDSWSWFGTARHCCSLISGLVSHSQPFFCCRHLRIVRLLIIRIRRLDLGFHTTSILHSHTHFLTLHTMVCPLSFAKFQPF